ncbi:Na+/H+ antiporter [Burkholderia pseudomallei]|uniref:Na+/H+ antiporter n=1 Tax=Burkholderia pseudomallei TaxID=28450 RepID=UPI003F65C56F
MTAFEIVLTLLLSVVLSGICAKALPFAVPLPLVQIAFGAVIAAFAGWRVQLDPQVFFVLVLPPLLFYDGWRVSKEGLQRDKKTVLALAIGLVVFTVGGVGLFVHWLIPAIPLSVAFALGAIISPTDPVAVSAIAARTAAPARLMRILEGEALFNDASGVVCMRFAVAATLTSSFSLFGAVGSFLWASIGGLALGGLLTWAIALAKGQISQRYGEDTALQILISLLIPFGAYLLGEMCGCSGILAAVAAGVTMSYVEQTGGVLAITRVRRTAVWETLYTGISGVIFILLGEQLPEIGASAAHAAHEAGQTQSVWLFIYVALVTVVVVALRFIWVWASLRFTLSSEKEPVTPGLRLIAATSLAGVRGTVTLAAVLTLPLTLADGRPFPGRELAIFLAAGVIFLSLLAACLLLPFFFRSLQLPSVVDEQEEENQARVAASSAALSAIGQAEQHLSREGDNVDLYAEAAARVMALYQHRIEALSKSGEGTDAVRKIDEIARQLHLAGMRAERAEIYRLARSRDLPDEIARRLVREIDLLEAKVATSPGNL